MLETLFFLISFVIDLKDRQLNNKKQSIKEMNRTCNIKLYSFMAPNEYPKSNIINTIIFASRDKSGDLISVMLISNKEPPMMSIEHNIKNILVSGAFSKTLTDFIQNTRQVIQQNGKIIKNIILIFSLMPGASRIMAEKIAMKSATHVFLC